MSGKMAGLEGFALRAPTNFVGSLTTLALAATSIASHVIK
jgi:hypothetical protein